MKDCLFCKIVTGEIPSTVIHENANYLAFLDINPLNPGHALAIPKKHYRWVWDDETIGEYMMFCKSIANAQRSAFDTDQVVSLIFGEEVPHAHIWLVPRLPNDGHGDSIKLDNHKRYTDDEMRGFADKIRRYIKD